MSDMAEGFEVRAYVRLDDAAGTVEYLCGDCALDEEEKDENNAVLNQIEEYDGEDTLKYVLTYTCERCSQKQTRFDSAKVTTYNDELCYYLGRCDRPDEGIVRHDVKLRPVRLGPGEYTFVGNPGFCEPEITKHGISEGGDK